MASMCKTILGAIGVGESVTDSVFKVLLLRQGRFKDY